MYDAQYWHNQFEFHQKRSVDTNAKPRKTQAQKMARDLLKHAQISTFPVILNDIFVYLRKDKTIYVDFMDLGPRYSGALVKAEDDVHSDKHDTWHIVINSTESKARQRFTLAHELGHMLFDTVCSGGKVNTHAIEQECNIFASHLLMPEKELKKDLEYMTVPDIAKKYVVSKRAVWVRVR